MLNAKRLKKLHRPRTNHQEIHTGKAQLTVDPTKDVEEAKKLFTSLLGTEAYIDGPNYVGYRTEGREIGLDPNGSSSGPIA